MYSSNFFTFLFPVMYLKMGLGWTSQFFFIFTFIWCSYFIYRFFVTCHLINSSSCVICLFWKLLLQFIYKYRTEIKVYLFQGIYIWKQIKRHRYINLPIQISVISQKLKWRKVGIEPSLNIFVCFTYRMSQICMLLS